MNQTVEQQLQGKKILFVTSPLDGHFNPLTGLAKFLLDSGCDVRWYTSTIFTEKLARLSIPHYPFKRALDLNFTNLETLHPERKEIKDPIEKMNWDMINIFLKRGPEYFEDIQEIYQSFTFDLVIGEIAVMALPIIKHVLKVPVICIGIVPLSEYSEELAPYGMGMQPPADEKQQAEYAGLRAHFVNSLMAKPIDLYTAILNDHGIELRETMTGIVDYVINESTLHLQIGIPEFEYKRSDIGKNIRFIGALLPCEKENLKRTWFDDRLLDYHKILLVTQGTAEPDVTKLLEPTLKAFSDSDTLVIATTGGFETARLKEQYPAKNLIIADSIPFNEVMPHATVYLTNGGYGGVMLSIINKLPMVAAGINEGKIEVCARVGYFNCGINLNTELPTAEAIKEAITQISSTQLYKESVTKLAGKFASYDAFQLSARYIAELLYNLIPSSAG